MVKISKKKKDKRGRKVAREMEREAARARAEEEMAQLKDEELFEVTERAREVKRRFPLDPLRFKRKMWKFMGRSKHEAKLIERLKKKMLTKKEERKVEPEMKDLWEESVPRGKNKSRGKPAPFVSCMPAVVLPHGGQSYNPSASDYKVCCEMNRRIC
eukprot:TRINITY_DN10535_c0_g1_i7.p3 TRINITY_DN10535_c0_g1~~TRINITY_DN10535_c0_g1_i7.p3  ORF type:complete len:157 (-),score=69.23 TRINITY_DN10535_c0_g1_i7:742-1212(-)